MRRRGAWYLRLVFCSVLLAVAWSVYSQGPPPNLLPNSGFEEIKDGAPVGWTKADAGEWSLETGLFGDRSLQLKAPAAGEQNGTSWGYSSWFPVTGGKLYLLVFWAKGPASWPRGADSMMQWSFKQADGTGLPQKQEHRVPIAPSYAAGKWQVGHYVVRAPAEATSAQLALYVVTSETNPAALQFDALRVSEYQPPEPGKQSWFYAAATYGVSGEQVEDAQATKGRVWRLPVGKYPAGGKISGPLISEQDPGQYRALFRMKVADNTIAKPVAYIRITGDNLVNVSQTAGLTVLGTDFAQPNEYQEFPVEFIRSPLGGLQYLVDWYGLTDMSLDGVTVREEKLLADLDWVSLYGLPTAGPVGELGPGALVCRGLGCPAWRLEPALALAGAQPVKSYWFYTGAGGLPHVTPDFGEKPTGEFPQRVEDLQPYSVVVLADVPADALGFAGRQALRQFVEAGGGLLVLGGYYSYGRGAIARSFLEEMLPVAVTDTWDLAPAGVAVQAVEGLALPSNVAWVPAPQCLWLHQVRAKPEGKVVLKAGDKPFLVVGEFGKGRVAACAGTIMGAPGAGQQPFWEWKDWPKVLFATVDYLRQGRDW